MQCLKSERCSVWRAKEQCLICSCRQIRHLVLWSLWPCFNGFSARWLPIGFALAIPLWGKSYHFSAQSLSVCHAISIVLPCNLYRFTVQFACFLIAIARCLRQQVVGRERCFVDRPEQTRAVSRGILRGFVEQTNVVPAFSFEQKLAHTLL